MFKASSFGSVLERFPKGGGSSQWSFPWFLGILEDVKPDDFIPITRMGRPGVMVHRDSPDFAIRLRFETFLVCSCNLVTPLDCGRFVQGDPARVVVLCITSTRTLPLCKQIPVVAAVWPISRKKHHARVVVDQTNERARRLRHETGRSNDGRRPDVAVVKVVMDGLMRPLASMALT